MLCAGSEAKRFMNHAVAAGDAGERSEPSRGLYRPDEFRDNCGFGLIAHIEGEASHRLLQTAIESLTCMTHRGGIAADGRTGDGCEFSRAGHFGEAKLEVGKIRMATT